MESNLTRQQAAERNAELCDTFAKMVNYAAENGVTVIVIAGDLFDTKRIRSTTIGCIQDIIAQHPNIDFLYLRGNHDESECSFTSSLPANLKVFSDNWQYHRYDNVVIAGVELAQHNCTSIYTSLKLKKEDVNIVVLHGQESTQPGAEAVCIPLLKNKQIRYLALGHLHSYKLQPLDHFGQYCYSGCLEGRGFDECGEKGFVLLDIKEDRLRTEFVPFAYRKMHEIRVDITGQTQANRIASLMIAAAKGIAQKDLVKFILCGSYTTETNKDLTYLQNAISSKFYFAKIADESKLFLERSSYENDISLKGEFTRLVMDSSLSDSEKERIIYAGLQALSGEEITL
jgi:DNA repair exonuclease SbcCD nuclease subunit